MKIETALMRLEVEIDLLKERERLLKSNLGQLHNAIERREYAKEYLSKNITGYKGNISYDKITKKFGINNKRVIL